MVVPMIYGAALQSTASTLARTGEPFTKEDFTRAKEIRRAIWATIPGVKDFYSRMQQIARHVAKTNTPFRWITPSGFEVAQDSRKTKKRPAIDVILPSGRFQAWEHYPTGRIDQNKQARSFAANFVHSYDAALLSLIALSSANGPAAIHDWACAHDSIAVPAWRGFELLSLAGDKMHEMHTPDNLGETWLNWRENGMDVGEPPGKRCNSLPRPISARTFYVWS